MARGGPRNGAGRKAGVQNKINAEIRQKAIAGGILPLDYMLKVMRDKEAETARRDDMAKAAAPYLHAKLAAIEHKGDVSLNVSIVRFAEG